MPKEFWFPDILNRIVLKDFSAFGATEQRNSLISGLKVVSSPILNAGWLLSIGSPAFHLVLISGKKAYEANLIGEGNEIFLLEL